MKNYLVSLLIMVAIMAAFWAYIIVDTLIREFSTGLTYIDLGVIYLLGLISGVALGFVLGWRRNKPRAG